MVSSPGLIDGCYNEADLNAVARTGKSRFLDELYLEQVREMRMARKPLPAGMDTKAIELPAPFVNRFQVAAYPGGLVRISFAEAMAPGSENYRSAIIMETANARDLAHTLLNVLAPTDRKSS
jgi:hypothetical protein